MFRPPRCPNPQCPEHHHPRRGFYVRRGFYHPLCRADPVPRFRCRTCGRGFSRQTFRPDYRDHRPDLNGQLFLLLCSGVGLRQTAREVGLSLRCTELKYRKIARHLGTRPSPYSRVGSTASERRERAGSSAGPE